jgi:hypothetical protein
MIKSIHIVVFLCLFMPGLVRRSTEYVRIEKLSDRVIIGYRLGTGRTNVLAIKSQKSLGIIDTEMSPRTRFIYPGNVPHTFCFRSIGPRRGDARTNYRDPKFKKTSLIRLMN